MLSLRTCLTLEREKQRVFNGGTHTQTHTHKEHSFTHILVPSIESKLKEREAHSPTAITTKSAYR